MRDGTYTTVSLFTGAMGQDIGLEQTGRFQVLACVEKVPAFCETIRANRDKGRVSTRNLRVFEAAVEDLDPAEVLESIGLAPGELDLLTGGPPCQSFSTAGRRGTVRDPRGSLLWQFLRYVDAMRPRFFLMENVRGLISAALRHRPIAQRPDKGGPPLEPDEEPGSVIRLFGEDLQRLGGASYHMDCFEVNAVNYGAPQLRERALFIGNRYNVQVEFPPPTHGPPVRGAHHADLFRAPSDGTMPWRTLRDAIGHLDSAGSDVMDFSPRKKKYLAMVPPGSNWRSLPEPLQRESMGRAWYAKGGRSGWWRRLSYDLPCPTLVTMPNHASTSLCHPNEVRALSLREYSLVQEFPEDWEFSGTTAERYAQAGNAVPIRLARVAGALIAEQLDRLRGREWAPYPDPPEAYRIVYMQSHVRTRRWYSDGETFVWDDGSPNRGARYAAPRTRRRERTI